MPGAPDPLEHVQEIDIARVGLLAAGHRAEHAQASHTELLTRSCDVGEDSIFEERFHLGMVALGQTNRHRWPERADIRSPARSTPTASPGARTELCPPMRSGISATTSGCHDQTR